MKVSACFRVVDMAQTNLFEAKWSNNLVDADKILEEFFAGCVAAGPDRCALYDSTTKKVEARLNVLLESLKRRPLAVSLDVDHRSSTDYGLVDYELVRRLLFDFIYNPYADASIMPGAHAAPLLASALHEAEKGNGWPLWDAYKSKDISFHCQCPGSTSVPAQKGLEHTLAILCGDGDEVKDSIEELEDFQARMAETSTFAELWTLRARCV